MSTRRAFVLTGGAAALGAAVVGAAARSTPLPTQDHDAVRRAHLAFSTAMENGDYEAAANLFDERAHVQLSGVSARGKAAIRHLFTHQYRHQEAAVIHTAYRQGRDEVSLSDDGGQATATFHVDVELCTPLQPDCTAAQMARLQGNVAERRWEPGRLEAQYVKIQGEWRIASLSYLPA
jgi:ketosteroid isomerase-like protein